MNGAWKTCLGIFLGFESAFMSFVGHIDAVENVFHPSAWSKNNTAADHSNCCFPKPFQNYYFLLDAVKIDCELDLKGCNLKDIAEFLLVYTISSFFLSVGERFTVIRTTTCVLE